MITFEGQNYYTQQEVADYLHCSKSTIINRIYHGRIQGTHFGRNKYYTEAQIQEIKAVNTYTPKQ